MGRVRAGQDRRRAEDLRVGRGRIRRARLRDQGAGARVGQEEDHAGRRWSRWLGWRLPCLPRHRVGPRHDRTRHHAGHGQAGLQHLLDHAGRAHRLRLLLPGLRRRRHLRRLRELGGRLQVRLPHVRRQDHLPVALQPQHHRRPAHPAPQGARVHHGRQVPVGGQGLRGRRHPASDAPVPVSGPRLSQDQDAVEVRRSVDRHHDQRPTATPRCTRIRAWSSSSASPSGSRARCPSPTSSCRPAPTSSAGTSPSSPTARATSPTTSSRPTTA